MKFDGMEKKEIYSDRKKYTFYIKSRKGFGYYGLDSSNVTIYVDDIGNIINIFPGRFMRLDGKILTIKDNVGDHNSYYNIDTGELLFTEYDKIGRHYGVFENGIVLIYDYNINNYHIMTIDGEIGNCNLLYRIGKKSLLVMENAGDETLSLYDYNMNIIKKDVSLKYESITFNSECFVCCGEDIEGKYYCICDHLGNIVSDKFEKIDAKDIFNMQEVVAIKRNSNNKMIVNYKELIN